MLYRAQSIPLISNCDNLRMKIQIFSLSIYVYNFFQMTTQVLGYKLLLHGLDLNASQMKLRCFFWPKDTVKNITETLRAQELRKSGKLGSRCFYVSASRSQEGVPRAGPIWSQKEAGSKHSGLWRAQLGTQRLTEQLLPTPTPSHA